VAPAETLLSLLAALFFLLIGLEELPFSFNVHRVSRQVRRRMRRRGQPAQVVLDSMARNTRISCWILSGFALASGLALAYLRWADARPGPPEGVQAFGATLVVGLLFLVFAYARWAPRLMARVAAEVDQQTSGSNAPLPFNPEKRQDGHDPRVP
jgi:hypothetical protein